MGSRPQMNRLDGRFTTPWMPGLAAYCHYVWSLRVGWGRRVVVPRRDAPPQVVQAAEGQNAPAHGRSGNGKRNAHCNAAQHSL